MFKIKRILSLILLVIGGWVGASLLTHFSVAQSYGPQDSDLIAKSFSFRMPNNAVYLYAVFEPNTYKIYFDGNWSTSWNMWSLDMVYGEEENLPPNNFERNWYTFGWWSSSKTWVVEYLDQAGVKNLTAEDSGEVILYAQRNGNEVLYTVEYYQEKLDWTWYDLVGSDVMSGIVWTEVILTWKEYTWFTLQTGAEVSISSGCVVPYYYTRNTYNLIIKDRDKVLVDTWIKYWADIPLPPDPEWTWNMFTWWDNLPGDEKMPANDLEIMSKWSYGAHTITFDSDGWTDIEPISGNYGDPIIPPDNPTKTWYEFIWWEPELPETIPFDDIVVKAVWKEVWGNWKWWSGWWWRKWWTSDTPDESNWGNQHGTSEDDNQPGRWMVDLETFFAYMWAHDMWIIEASWEDSDPDGYVTRWAMAEMVVKFSEKVLERETPSTIPAQCAWWDDESEWEPFGTKAYAEKACALWVMWIRMKNFMPNKILDRAEFGTILSRLLWWDIYDVVDATKTKPYYTKHLEALNEKKIMTQIVNPEKKKELRKWAWLMLMRSRIGERREK